MEERVQKLIAMAEGISRRAADDLVLQGRVAVNGVTAEPGRRADPERDRIHIDGRPLVTPSGEKLYIMLNKPVGYVTTMHDEKGRRTVAELVDSLPARVYPVGRLDINSSGLLLMTNDGEFANRICHPSFEKKKTYRVAVTGNIECGIKTLLSPMVLDGILLRQPQVRLVRCRDEVFTLDITIHEGRNRQIRRMCEMAGLTVRSLTRTCVGGVRLGNLGKGQWRYLTLRERELLSGDRPDD